MLSCYMIVKQLVVGPRSVAQIQAGPLVMLGNGARSSDLSETQALNKFTK